MKRFSLAGVILAVSVCSFISLPIGEAASGAAERNFGTISTVTTTSAFSLQLIIPKHTVQVATAGSPSSCVLHLEGTVDNPAASGSTWADLSGDIDCSNSVTFHVVNKPVFGVRVNVTTLSGGTQANVTLKYAGVQ